MSWNPRRFLAAVGNVETLAPGKNALTEAVTHLWLTEDALERIVSGVNSGALEPAPLSEIPSAGMTLGMSHVRDCAFVFLPAGVQGVLREMAERSEPTKHINTETAVFFLFGMHGKVGSVGVVYTEGSEERMGILEGDPRLSGALDIPGVLSRIARLALTLYTQPVEQDAAAVTVERQNVSTHKKNSKARKARTQDISVIDVRRDSIRYAGEHRHVEHDHRWKVRGHLRNQAYGPGRSLRKLIWVSEQVRGPEDKPLLRTPRVHRL